MSKSPFTTRIAKLMVGGAVIAAAVFAIEYGWHKGTSTALSLALVIGLVCVVLGEVLSWHNMAASWYERRLGAVMLWGALGVILSTGTLYTNFSTAAGNGEVNASIQKASFVKYENAGDRLKAAKAEEKRWAEKLEWMNTAFNGRPVRTAEAAQADIDKARGNTRFWSMTDGCKETKGPQTRAYCAAYRDALAEFSLAADKVIALDAYDKAKRDVAKWSEKAVTDKAVVTDDAANIVALASFLNVDNSKARQADSMILGILVQAMLVLGGIMLATEAYRHVARQPWIDWEKLIARLALLRDVVTGRWGLPELDHTRPVQKASEPVQEPSTANVYEKAITDRMDAMKLFRGRVASRSPVDGSVLSLPVNFQPAGA